MSLASASFIEILAKLQRRRPDEYNVTSLVEEAYFKDPEVVEALSSLHLILVCYLKLVNDHDHDISSPPLPFQILVPHPVPT
jgi:hypothetical protein